jgi:hypothetical protein
MTTYLSRCPPADHDGPPSPPIDPGGWGRLYPALVEFLTATQWEDHAPRLPGTMTLFCDGSVWKLCLSDRAQGRVAFTSSCSPDELLAAAESGLVANTLDWRAQRPASGKKTGKGA